MPDSIRLSTAQLKGIALASMVCDHVGAVFFPQYAMMRHIGRMAFAIFVFALVEGFFYTKSRPAYLGRLLIFALVSEVPFDLGLFGQLTYWKHQNAFFTLALGLAAMIGMEWAFVNIIYEPLQLGLQMMILTAAMTVSFFCMTDYKGYGVCVICVAYLLRRREYGKVFEIIMIVGVLTVGSGKFSSEIWAALAIPFVCLYDENKSFSVNRWLFYGFYPLHLAAIYLVRVIR